MKNFLIILFLMPVLAMAQNPYPVPCISYAPNGDTIITTTLVKGTGKTFSSKVTQTATTSTVVHPFKPVVTPPPANKPPSVTITGVTSITAPAASVTLTANATDPENGPIGLNWQKVSGPVATINSPAGSPCLINGLVPGTYVFSVTATDNGGLTATASVTVTVNPAVVVTPPAGRSNLTFQSTFEGITNWIGAINSQGYHFLPVDIGETWLNEQHYANYSISAAPIARAGSTAVKFDLRPGDGQVSGSYRSELTGPGTPSTEYEGWWGMSFYPVNLAGNDLSVVQWHSDYNNGQGTPPLGLWVTGNNQWCVVRTKSGFGSGNDYGFLPGNVVKNKWTDFVFHIKFSATSAGILEVWQDGIKVYSYTGVTNYPSTVYMKSGIYQWDGITGEQIMYADEFRIGSASATYNDVKPGN